MAKRKTETRKLADYPRTVFVTMDTFGNLYAGAQAGELAEFGERITVGIYDLVGYAEVEITAKVMPTLSVHKALAK